jgi:acylphosphatase
MVQGVGFRFFAHRAAERLGVAGYVKNLWDGRVEVYAIGRGEQLRAMRAELERGPRGASISGVAEEDAEVLARYTGHFSIEQEW